MALLVTPSARYDATLRDFLGLLSSEWLVRQHDEDPIRWTAVQPRTLTLPAQGWKLHVSAAHTQAIELCHRVLPFLVTASASFKIPSDLESFVAINSGRAGATQVGKILTIYGSLTFDFATLVARMGQLWAITSGPSVPSDLQVIGTNALFLRYGVIAASQTMVDRLGRHAFVLRRPDGVDVPDQRSTDGSQPSWALPPPVPCSTLSKISIDTRFRIAGEEYVPMILLRGSTRGATYLGISLKDGRSVILKTQNPGLAWSVTGVDAVDLLEREYGVLVDACRRTNVAPRPIGFDSSSGGVLAMEDLDGDSLEDMPRASLIALLPLMADAVARLHSSGYVHRDIKLSNAVAVNGAVRLVDFGLASKIGHCEISGGTRNYIPPEGTDTPAAPAADVFSLGVAIAHAFLGVDPATLPAPTSRVLGLLRLSGEPDVVRLLRSVLDRNPERRPPASSVAGYLADVLARSRTPHRPTLNVSMRAHMAPGRLWCMRAAASAGKATRQFFQREKTTEVGWWRNGHMESGFACEGMNLGAAGIILGLIAIDHALHRSDFERDVTLGCNWLTARPPSEEARGLLSGDAGVALALAIAGRRYNRVDWIVAARTRLESAANVKADYDLFSGAAGVLYVACTIDRVLNEEWPRAIGRRLAGELVSAARLSKGMRVWPAFDEKEAPLTGAAHGCAGIALALAEWSKRARDDYARDVAIDAFSRLFDHGRLGEGALVRSLDDSATPTEDRLWCHGAAGYIWCLLVGLGDECLLREAIDWSVERFLSSSALTSPVYCHGLAGQLDLCRVLSGIERFKSRAEERAAVIAGTLRLLAERRAGSIVWMSEEPDTTTPDLWIGFLGPAVALSAHAAASQVSMFSLEWFAACSNPTGR